jgi:hypothetical protein
MKSINRKKVVSVFGNEMEEQDNLAVRLVPELEKRFKEIEFRISDPTETLEPPSDPWVILDVGMGIEEVVVIEDLGDLDFVKGQSVHDYDVYMELRLKEKLGKLPKIKILLIPSHMPKIDALRAVVAELNRL